MYHIFSVSSRSVSSHLPSNNASTPPTLYHERKMFLFLLKAVLAERLTEALERKGAGTEGTKDSDEDIGTVQKDEPEGVCTEDKYQEEVLMPGPMDVGVDSIEMIKSSDDAGSDPHEADGYNGEGSRAADASVTSANVPDHDNINGDASSGVAAVNELPAVNVEVETPQFTEIEPKAEGGDLDRDDPGELDSFVSSMEAEVEIAAVDRAGGIIDEPQAQAEASAMHDDGGAVNGSNASEVSATGVGHDSCKGGGSTDTAGGVSGIEAPSTNVDKETAPSASVTFSKPFTPTVIYPNASRAPSNSQDTYAYEEEQERLAMLKSLHRPMRQWFNEDPTLKEKHGNFPMFWQDLASWPPMRELKRMYLVAIERKENPDAAKDDACDEAMPDVAVSAEGQAPTTSVSAATTVVTVNGDSTGNASGSFTGDGDDNSGEGGKKKRKKRWGEAARKNRFSNKDDDEPVEVEGGGDASGSGSPPSKARKSRWSSEATNSAAEALPAGTTGGVIPGMPVNLSQEQIQETLVLQVRLTQANEKLATVDQDAIARSQDPDRSPSPPPRYDSNGVRTNPRNVRMREALNRERSESHNSDISVV